MNDCFLPGKTDYESCLGIGSDSIVFNLFLSRSQDESVLVFIFRQTVLAPFAELTPQKCIGIPSNQAKSTSGVWGSSSHVHTDCPWN